MSTLKKTRAKRVLDISEVANKKNINKIVNTKRTAQ